MSIIGWYSRLTDREELSKSGNCRAMFRNVFELSNNRQRLYLAELSKTETTSTSLDEPLRIEEYTQLRNAFQATCPEFILCDAQILPKNKIDRCHKEFKTGCFVHPKLDYFHTQACVSILPPTDKKLELQSGVTINIQSDSKQSLRAGTKVDTPEKYLMALEVRLYSEAIAGCYEATPGVRFVSLSNFLQYIWRLRNLVLTYSRLGPYELLHLLRTKDELIRSRWATALSKGFATGVTYNQAILSSEQFIEIIMVDTTGCPTGPAYRESAHPNKSEPKAAAPHARIRAPKAPKANGKGSSSASSSKPIQDQAPQKGKKATKGKKGKGVDAVKTCLELNGKRNCAFYNTGNCTKDKNCSFGHVCDVLMPAPKNAQCGGNHPRILHHGATQPL
jgi:hypothetical protein